MMKPLVPTAQEAPSIAPDQAGVLPAFILPDASFLLYGSFSQDGFDLVITNPAGDKVTVADYFSFEPAPNLVLPNGAGLTPSMVKSLFPKAFGDEVLFAGPAPSGAALTEIGTITLVVGTVTVRHADGSQDTLSTGDTLFKGDVILTAAGSFVKAEMLDGTRFHLGQSGEVALDDFTFDEALGQGQFDATVRVGGFYYKSGDIAEMAANLNRAHTTLKTPSAIIGVRGSELEGSVSPEGQTVVVHRSGILEITDLNGENPVTLVEPGNTAIVILNGVPAFSPELPQEVETILEQSLLPPSGPGDGPGPEATPDNIDPTRDGPDGVSGDGVAGAQAGNAAQSNNTVGPGDGQGQQQGPSNDGPANSPGSPQSLENLSSVNQATPALISVASFQTNAIETQQMPAQVAMIAQPNIELLPADSPPLTQPDTLEITGTAPLEISSLLLANDDDPDTSGELTVISASGGTGSFVVDQGNVTYFPDQALLLSLGANETETQIITYEVESGGQIASGVLTITYLGENEAPVVQSETAQISEDTQLELPVLDNATDTDVQDTLTIASLDTSNLTGTAEISADGQSLIYNPPQDMDSGTRTEVFSYSISDGTVTSTATVTITVTGVNDSPVIESDPSSFSVDVGSGLVEIPLSAIFSDADSASELTVVALATSSAEGATVSEGSVLYDPGNIFINLSEDEIGTDSFAITVQDDHGATVSGTFAFQVIGANDAPTANSDSEVLLEDGSIVVAAASGVLVNDEDPDTLDTLVVSAIRTGILSGSGVSAMPGDALQGTYGTLTLYADGSYDYQANLAAADALAAGEVATDVFTYTVSDDALTSLNSDAELAFTITGTNDAPALLDATQINTTVTELEDGDPSELTDYLTGSGSFTFEDLDLETHTVSVQAVASNATSLGDVDVTVTSAGGSGLVEWNFAVVDADLDYLEDEESLTQDYIITVSDGQGSSFDQTVTVTLVGSYDSPNSAPYLDSTDVVYQHVVVEEPYTETFVFYDVDGDDLTLGSAIPAEIDSYISFTPDLITDTNGYTQGTMILSALFVEGTVGDYLITVSADDGLNAEVGDTFVFSVRDPDVIVEGAGHQFVAGEAELVASNHGDDPGLGDVELLDAGPGDRVQFMAHIDEIYLTSNFGSTVTLYFSDGGGFIDANASPGPDAITLVGDITGLEFRYLGFNDTLINETEIYATHDNFTLDAGVENNGDFYVSGSSNGNYYNIGLGTGFEQAHNLAHPVLSGNFSQGESGVLDISRQGSSYGGYLLTLEIVNAGSISVSGEDDYSSSLVSVLEVQSVSTGQLEMGAISQSASGTLSIGGGGIVSAGSLDNNGLVVLEADYYSHASLLLDGTYNESGTLWSTSSHRDFYYYTNTQPLNEIFLDSFVLAETGRLILDAPLVFRNPGQTVDLRLGQVVFEAGVGVLGLEGGTLILGENTEISGYGLLGFFDFDGSGNDTGTIVVDSSFTTSNVTELVLEGAVVTFFPANANAELVVAANTELDLSLDVIEVDLVNQGWIFVSGADNEINGHFDNSAGLLAIEVGYDADETGLHIGADFVNQGIIEILLEASISAYTAQGNYSEYNIGFTSESNFTNEGLLFIDEDVTVEDDGYGSDPSYDFNVNIQADITNHGLIQVAAGQVSLTGDVINSGTIRVIGSNGSSSAFSSLNGSSLIITGNLTLEATSFVELEVNLNDTDTMAISGLEASLIQPSGSSTDLGTLSLLFDANHNFYPDEDPLTANTTSMSLDLGSSYQSGADFSTVQTNLAAGYDLNWSASGGAITLQVSDGMEAVVSQASEFSSVGETDDIRIIGDLMIDQVSQTINSFSIEKWTPEDTGTQTETIGALHLGDTDTVAESFELIVMDDSTVAPSLELYVGAGNEGAGNDTSILTLNGLLTVNGILQLDQGGQINGLGSITIADEASADLEGGTLDLNLTVLQGGWVNAGASFETLELDGQGSIINHSDLYLSGNLTLGIDVDNQHQTEINGGAQIALATGADIVFTNQGVLATDAGDDVSFDLGDNTLDTRGGELALFTGVVSTTLSGGTTGADGLIRMDGETSFSVSGGPNYYSGATLTLEGSLTFSLSGIIDLKASDPSQDLILDGSNANSVNLVNEGSGTALLVNFAETYFNNLTSSSDVAIGNINTLRISGESLISGDLYNVYDDENGAYITELFLDDSIVIRGDLIAPAGTRIDAGFNSQQFAMVLANDFVNEGNFFFLPQNEVNAHVIEFGEGLNVSTFTNEGLFQAGDGNLVTMELQGIIINQGYFELTASSILKLSEESTPVTHENHAEMALGEDARLALGHSNTLLNGASGLFYGAAGSSIDLTSSGASFINEGHLYVGDEPGDEYTGELEFLTSLSSGEVVFESGSELNIDIHSQSADHLLISSEDNAGGVLRINGGYLNINATQSSVATGVVIVTAVSILGSFDEVEGLVFDNVAAGSSPLLDMVQSATSITLVPVAASEVIEGTSSNNGEGGVVHHDDLIDMNSASQTFVLAGGGDDTIVNIRASDTVYGQEGDDTFELELETISVRRIDGGEGIDSIVLPDVAASFDFQASTGWLGTTFDNIEVLRMDNASQQTLDMDASAISRIIDGANELIGEDSALVVLGNIGDSVNLYGDFETSDNRYAEIDGGPTLLSAVSEGDVSLYFDQHTRVHVYENDDGVSIYGTAEDEALEGTEADETLSGRAGDDVLDAGAGVDLQLGGDGNDQIMYDAMDSLIDGGRGVDTVTINGIVDLSGVENLNNVEILDMSNNGTADTLELNLADLVDMVGDNSLNAYEEGADNKVLVINGDAEDTVILNGLDLDAIAPTASEVDLFGDGELYYLFQENGVSLYVHSDLSDSAEEDQEKPASGHDLDHYMHNSQVDAFGMI
ncbi:MAG: cadherin-like domain-containing protein [Gammaproteobacteria bacterium]|nr:cadherin-like domain-containing protein [Gammaproteobacteria bacterium]